MVLLELPDGSFWFSPVLRASLWLSVTHFPPKALFNFPANWTARPPFLKKKHEFSQKGKYWIIFSENFMIFKLYRLSWMCSLSFGLCVYYLDMKLKVQIFFYLTSLRHNPSLNRHGYLYLCLFTIKKMIIFSLFQGEGNYQNQNIRKSFL